MASSLTPSPFLVNESPQFGDLIQVSKVSGLPLKFPSNFPVMTVGAMRLLLAVQKHASDKYIQCIEKVATFRSGAFLSIGIFF